MDILRTFQMQLVALTIITIGSAFGAAQELSLASKARTVLETHCYRCHGKDGKFEASFGSILDSKKLVERKKIVVKKPEASRIYEVIANSIMPPDSEKLRPSKLDLEVIRDWIESGATELPEPTIIQEQKRNLITLKDSYQLMYKHLLDSELSGGAQYQRFFTLTHLYNNPKITDDQLRLYRAGLAKMINSLSWRKAVVYPKPIDPAGTILAIDLRDLDWDINNNWGKIIKGERNKIANSKPLHLAAHNGYPYALKHDSRPDSPDLNTLAKQVYLLSRTDIPAIRVDWFISAVSLPPLYYDLLNIPLRIEDLENQLKVNSAYNFQRDKIARAGFVKSVVSNQNRLVERHNAVYGMYWKSFDFKENEGTSSLLKFPLGPLNLFPAGKHPHSEQAFVHDGGEMIWSLPNGLHAYMLTDGQGNRIDFGPTEVVRDPKETAGRGPAIVNGVSCMACHKHGVIDLPPDDIRLGSGLRGKSQEKIRRLYPTPKDMQLLLDEDESDYLTTIDRIITPYLRIGKDKNKTIKEFPEVVTYLAGPYLKGSLNLDQASLELEIPSEFLRNAIKVNAKLRETLGLKSLTVPEGIIRRQVLESIIDSAYSKYQEIASELDLGTIDDLNETDIAPKKTGQKTNNLENTIEEAIKLEMVLIPAGKFKMGAPASEKGRSSDETQHEVNLTKPYYMGKYEVTQEQWESVMGSNPSSKIKGARLPVTDVSWEDCQEFIKKLNASTKGGYRLPTESEWEYACRAGTSTAYSFGDSLSKADANTDGDSTKTVGNYKPNAFGLYDMHGNIWEWCEDWYGDYPSGAVTDPNGPGTGDRRVLRGGSFYGHVSEARASYRYFSSPTTRVSGDGFRLVRTK